MKYNIERRQSQYKKAKKRVEKMYKGCKLSARERAGFFIECGRPKYNCSEISRFGICSGRNERVYQLGYSKSLE